MTIKDRKRNGKTQMNRHMKIEIDDKNLKQETKQLERQNTTRKAV